MRLMMVRAKIKADSTDEIEAAAIDREQLHGIRYASCQLADGVTYLNPFLELEDGIENPSRHARSQRTLGHRRRPAAAGVRSRFVHPRLLGPFGWRRGRVLVLIGLTMPAAVRLLIRRLPKIGTIPSRLSTADRMRLSVACDRVRWSGYVDL
jgi:hypothetical protein